MLVTKAPKSGVKELGEATLYIADKFRPKSFYSISKPIPVRYQIHTALMVRYIEFVLHIPTDGLLQASFHVRAPVGRMDCC